MLEYDNVVAFYTYRDVFSNHYRCQFTVRGKRFNCGEQYLMYCKAMFFKDLFTADLIMMETNPVKILMLGRKVKNFNQRLWRKVCFNFMVEGLRAKYTQNKDLGLILLGTGSKTIAEASKNKLWGVGIEKGDPNLGDPSKWSGENLLGRAHMTIREYLRNSTDPIGKAISCFPSFTAPGKS